MTRFRAGRDVPFHGSMAMMRRLALGALALTTMIACNPDRSASTSPEHPAYLLVSSPNSFTQVSAGGSHTCALRSDGVVECWGYDGNGQAPATQTAATGSFTQVSAAAHHTSALRSDGVVEGWGMNDWGQAVTRTATTGSFTQVSAGYQDNCALRSDAVVECWGYNPYGGAPATRTATTGSFTRVTAALATYSCALRNDGVVECWGHPVPGDDFGQAPATRTAAIGGFIQVSPRSYHSCALRSDGAVECWGRNDEGQAPATKTAATGSFTQVSAGGSHTCAVRTDGLVECWGRNLEGQAPPTRTAANGSFTQVSAGGSHTCALRSDGVVECWGDNTYGEAPATRTASPTISHVLPTATFTSPVSVVLGNAIPLSLTNAQVPGHPEATSFTFAFDCGDGAGYSAFSGSNTASCPTSAVGSRAVRGTVQDQDADKQEYTGNVSIVYNFSGFVAPVDNPPIVNVTKAGSAVPVKFSLHGNQGLNVLGVGSPSSRTILCDNLAPQDNVESTVSAGSSSLSYDPAADLYTYVWKTDKTWAGSCRELTVTLNDNSMHKASFRFTK